MTLKKTEETKYFIPIRDIDSIRYQCKLFLLVRTIDQAHGVCKDFQSGMGRSLILAEEPIDHFGVPYTLAAPFSESVQVCSWKNSMMVLQTGMIFWLNSPDTAGVAKRAQEFIDLLNSDPDEVIFYKMTGLSMPVQTSKVSVESYACPKFCTECGGTGKKDSDPWGFCVNCRGLGFPWLFDCHNYLVRNIEEVYSKLSKSGIAFSR
jgi:hypothetical protein